MLLLYHYLDFLSLFEAHHQSHDARNRNNSNLYPPGMLCAHGLFLRDKLQQIPKLFCHNSKGFSDRFYTYYFSGTQDKTEFPGLLDYAVHFLPGRHRAFSAES